MKELPKAAFFLFAISFVEKGITKKFFIEINRCMVYALFKSLPTDLIRPDHLINEISLSKH